MRRAPTLGDQPFPLRALPLDHPVLRGRTRHQVALDSHPERAEPADMSPVAYGLIVMGIACVVLWVLEGRAQRERDEVLRRVPPGEEVPLPPEPLPPDPDPEHCDAGPVAEQADRVRIIIDVQLDDPDIGTTLTVRPQIPLLQVAHVLRLLVEAIETGQINSLQLPQD